MQILEKTKDVYGFLWDKHRDVPLLDNGHIDDIESAVGQKVVNGRIGIDVGSGCGYDTYIMAKNNPHVEIVSIDISDGVYKTKRLVRHLNNVKIVKCSVLDMPVGDNVFDFAYSFGVLHHTLDPGKGISEIARILKKDKPAFIYVYEDHLGNFIKYTAIKIVSVLRIITTKLPAKFSYILSWIFSPLVFILFSLPAKILRKFKMTQCFADRVPFNFGTTIFSLRGDLYDRFTAPIEYRFSKKQIYDIFNETGFYGINITKLKNKAGWVIWGYKK